MSVFLRRYRATDIPYVASEFLELLPRTPSSALGSASVTLGTEPGTGDENTRGCNDPAEPAHLTPPKDTPPRVFSSPAPGEVAERCTNQPCR